jgi:hypothetical protein
VVSAADSNKGRTLSENDPAAKPEEPDRVTILARRLFKAV